MFFKRNDARKLRTITTVIVIWAATSVVVIGGSTAAQAAAVMPCDIYASGGTPCVAAHSTTRALYGAYAGRLYQVRRVSDNAIRDISALTAGGVANAAAQDTFCINTTCLITIIYDQSPRGNHLTQAPGGPLPDRSRVVGTGWRRRRPRQSRSAAKRLTAS